MKINFLLPGLGITGGNRVIFEHANRLFQRGHNVTVLYPAIPPRKEDGWLSPRARGTQFYGMVNRLLGEYNASWFGLEVPVQKIPALSEYLSNHFKEFIPDADVTIATAWETAYPVAKLEQSKGEKVYFVQHYEIWDTWNSEDAWEKVTTLTEDPASYPIEMYEVIPSNPKARRQKKMVDYSYQLPLSKITISKWLSKLLESKFDQNIIDVIANSVNHSTFYPEPTKDSENVSILFPLRDSPWKGEREAKKLVKEIGTRSDVEIHSYGSGQIDSVEYLNHHSDVSDRKLRRLYSNADIFVLPAWVEGFGLPPLEAMACKCAVVTTNVGAVPDYAEDGETALIVPPRDSSALINAVRELLENDKKRSQLQKQSYKAVNRYTWQDATIKFEQSLYTILGTDNSEGSK